MVYVPNFSAAPDRSDPASFSDRADVLAAELVAAVPVMNAQRDEVNGFRDAAAISAAAAINAPGTSAQSTTSLAIGGGVKALAIQTGKAFVTGQWVTVTSAGSPTNWMHGAIASYNSGSGALQVNVGYSNGAGTFTDWVVSISAPINFTAATAAQIFAGLTNLAAVTPAGLFASAAPVALDASGSTVPWDMSAGINFTLDLPGNRTLANPTNVKAGQSGVIIVTKASAANATLAAGGNLKHPAGWPSLTGGASSIDVISYFALSATVILCVITKGYS